MFRNLKLIIKYLLSYYWISILIIFILGVLFVHWILCLFPYSNLESARWTLSALVQSMAALVGLIIVGMTLLWHQSIAEEDNLRKSRDKYLWILVNADVKGKGNPQEGAMIEQLRKDYLGKIKSKCRSGRDFPFNHIKYKSDKMLFLELCALSELVDTFVHKGKRSNKELVDKDLQDLGWAKEGDFCYLRSLHLMGHPVTFFEVIHDIFGQLNWVLYELRHGWTLRDKIQNEFLNDNLYTGLERIKMFRRFKGTLFKMNIFAFIFTIVVGLGVLSSLSDSHFNPNLFLLPMTLGTISIGLLTITLNRLLHNE